MSRRIVRGVNFDGDSGGFVIEFLTPADDIRSSGLVLNHALLVPAEDPFIDLLGDLEEAIQVALERALALHAESPPIELPGEDDDRPYDHPDDGGVA